MKMKLLYMVIEYKFAEDDIDIIFIDDRASSYFTYSWLELCDSIQRTWLSVE